MSRFAVLLTLAGALLTLPLSATFALSENDQDAAIASLQNAVAALQSQNASQQTTINSQQTTIATQTAQINTLRGLLSSFSKKTDTTRADKKKGTELYITGMNLHIVDGTGSTADGGGTLSGLGNVIIGYNAPRGRGEDARTGSHNLVVGDENNYSSYGGMVCGVFNEISGIYNTISGGETNMTSAFASSISGGVHNTASADDASVSGGFGNTASGIEASVSGGHGNTARGFACCVVGGRDNIANGPTFGGDFKTVVGGLGNTASGLYSSVIGGQFVLENTDYGFAAGGNYSPDAPGPGTFHSP